MNLLSVSTSILSYIIQNTVNIIHLLTLHIKNFKNEKKIHMNQYNDSRINEEAAI